ncbi:MAG: SLBB domain-containing protein [Ignavibacteria bacterium]|jgi:protein involved in polysaccharide export with SLBB domain
MINQKFILFIIISTLMSLYSFAQVLNPGDGVRITFLDIQDEISGDYVIGPAGYLNLPFVGIISTHNKDFSSIRSQIEFRYDSLYRNPIMTVDYLLRINVLGEVRNPGFYYVTESEKFTELLALAGGTTASAELESIYIIRGNEEIDMDVNSIIKEGGSVSAFGLMSGDQIFVPRTWWSDRGITIVISAAALLVTVLALFLR